MRSSRFASITLATLALAATESALAYCPVPLTSASNCCWFAGPNGTVDNRNGRTLKGCIADALSTNSLLIIAEQPSCSVYTPYTFPPESWPASIINVQEVISPPIAPSIPSGEWRQNFRHIYTAQAILTNRYPAYVMTYTCADYSGHLNWVTPPVACELGDMPGISATDTCTTSLEANNGLPGSTAACPAVPVMTRTTGEPCFKGKLGTIGVAYNGPTSTIRTTAYNQHLTTVWDWYWKHQWLITDPVQYEACTAKRAAVTAELNKHGITYRPAPKSRHLTGRAFDASMAVINGMKPARIPRLLKSPTACTLDWGGGYEEPDYVHFELNVP